MGLRASTSKLLRNALEHLLRGPEAEGFACNEGGMLAEKLQPLLAAPLFTGARPPIFILDEEEGPK